MTGKKVLVQQNHDTGLVHCQCLALFWFSKHLPFYFVLQVAIDNSHNFLNGCWGSIQPDCLLLTQSIWRILNRLAVTLGT